MSSMQVWQALGPLIGVVLGAGISYLAQTFLLERQYLHWRSQRWWERKADAYTGIVEALWQRSEYASEYLKYLEGEGHQNVDIAAEKYRDMDKNLDNLRRAADIGRFVISDEVAESLKRYFEASGVAMNLIEIDEVVGADLDAVKRCLAEVRVAALQDLQIR